MSWIRTYICAPIAATGGAGGVMLNASEGITFADHVRSKLHEEPVDFAFRAIWGRWLNDDDPRDRAAGMACDRLLLARCNRVRVFLHGVSTVPTDGMREEIDLARSLGIPVFRGLTDEAWEEADSPTGDGTAGVGRSL